MNDHALHTHARLPLVLAVGALVLAAIGSAAGLLVGDLYRDAEAWIREAQATDLVTLVLAVPVLAASLWLARRPDPRWRLVAAGDLWYLAYSYAIFAFSVAPNELSLLYIAVLGTAAWALVLGIWRSPDAEITASTATRLPRLASAVFLLAVPALFGLLWLGEILSAARAEGPSEALLELGLPTNPIWPLDLAFALPVLAYAGLRLLRNDARAMMTVLPSLVFLVLIGFAVLGVFAFGIAAGAELEPVPPIIVGTITAIAIMLGIQALRPSSAVT